MFEDDKQCFFSGVFADSYGTTSIKAMLPLVLRLVLRWGILDLMMNRNFLMVYEQ